jgi:hypothetical protein
VCLRALGEQPADRVVVGRFGVVEDQRRRGEPLDGGRAARALRVGAHVEHFIADDRAYVQPVVVDGQQHNSGLQLAAPDALGDRGGVTAQEPDGHVRVALQEGRHDRLEPPRRRGAKRAQRHTPAAHRREFADAARRVLERAQALGGVLGERVAGVGGDDAAPGADEQVSAQRALELADLLGHGGLRHPERFRRGAERAELEGRAEAADLLQ